MNRFVFSLQIAEYGFSWLFCLLVFLGGILNAFVYTGSFGTLESVAGVLGIVTGGMTLLLVSRLFSRIANRQGMLRRVFVLATCAITLASLAIDLLFIQVTLSTLSLGMLLIELGMNDPATCCNQKTVLGTLDDGAMIKARLFLVGLIVASFAMASTFWMQWSVVWTNALLSSPSFAVLALGMLAMLLVLYMMLRRAWQEGHALETGSPVVINASPSLDRRALVARSIIVFVLAVLPFVYLALVDEQVNFTSDPAGYTVYYIVFPVIAVFLIVAAVVLARPGQRGMFSATNQRRWLLFWLLFLSIAVYYIPFLGTYESMFGRYMQTNLATTMHACMLLVLPSIGGIFLHQVMTTAMRTSSMLAVIFGTAGTLAGLVMYKGSVGYPGFIVMPSIFVIVLVAGIVASYFLSSAVAKVSTNVPSINPSKSTAKHVRPSGHFMIIGITCLVGIEMAFVFTIMDFSAISVLVPVVNETISAESLRGPIVVGITMVLAGTMATFHFMHDEARKKLGSIYCTPWGLISVNTIVVLVYYLPNYLGSREISIITRQYASLWLIPSAFLITIIAGGLIHQLAGYRMARVDIFYGILSAALGLAAGIYGYEMHLKSFDNIYAPAVACCVLVLTLSTSWVRARTRPCHKRRDS